jgi:hypothetical protein
MTRMSVSTGSEMSSPATAPKPITRLGFSQCASLTTRGCGEVVATMTSSMAMARKRRIILNRRHRIAASDSLPERCFALV